MLLQPTVFLLSNSIITVQNASILLKHNNCASENSDTVHQSWLTTSSIILGVLASEKTFLGFTRRPVCNVHRS